MLALALGGRSIAEWQSAISAREYQSWVAYWKAHPFDDDARYRMPAAALLTAQVGGEFGKHMDFLRRKPTETVAVIPPAPEGGWSEADLNTFKTLGAAFPPQAR